MQHASSIVCLALAASLAGCVTINIYFPAAAAEKAADRIIDDILQLKPDTARPVKPEAPK